MEYFSYLVALSFILFPLNAFSDNEKVDLMQNVSPSSQTESKLSFFDFINEAKNQIQLNQPEKALAAYQKAFLIADNHSTKKRIARFGIAKMQLWLGDYKAAKSEYETLMKDGLNLEDQQVALDGLIRSLTYQNQSSQAYQLIPKNFQYTNPSLIIAAAQTYFNTSHVAEAQSLLKSYHEKLETLPQNSFLAKQHLALNKEIESALAPTKNKKNLQQPVIQSPSLLNQVQSKPSLPFYHFLNTAIYEANQNHPELALEAYQKALLVAGNNVIQKHIASFGIGRMHLWLGKYKEAETDFQKLLEENLDHEDKEAALDGLVRSLDYQNQPQQAYYQLTPKSFHYTNPSLIIAAAQAYFDANEITKAQGFLATHSEKIKNLSKSPFLAKQLHQLNRNIEAYFETIRYQSFLKKINAAKTAVSQNQPTTALSLYQQASKLVQHDPLMLRIALFGIAKMQLWLGIYKEAELNYQKLMQENLDSKDKQVALDGLIRSINYQDRPKRAYQLIPKNIQYTNPSLVIAVAQVYYNVELFIEAEHLLEKYKKLLNTLPRQSILTQQFFRLTNDIKLAKKKAAEDREIKRLLDLGQAEFKQNRMKKAIAFYKQAMIIGQKDIHHRKNILFLLSEAQLSDGGYFPALRGYNQLLTLPHSKAEYELALNGYVRSLSSADRPMLAYQKIPRNFHYTMPTMLVGAAQAALWANWPYKSKKLLKDNPHLIKKIKPGSYLMRQLKDIYWQDNAGTSDNAVGFNSSHEKDTDSFRIERYQAFYSHRFGIPLNMSIRYNRNNYLVPDYAPVNIKIVTAQADGWLSDLVSYQANIAKAKSYDDHTGLLKDLTPFYQANNWNPFLWNASLNFQPNDYIYLTANNQKQLVESVPALQGRVSMKSSSINMLYLPVYRLKLNGTIYKNHFSDDNRREGYASNFSFLVFPNQGVYTEFFYRNYNNTNPSPFYFSPLRYGEGRFSLRLIRRLNDTWRAYLVTGVGRQRINHDPSTLTKLFEGGVYGAITSSLIFNATIGYNSAAGVSAAGNASPKYARKYGIASITYLFQNEDISEFLSNNIIKPW